jgi:hypothetical protein
MLELLRLGLTATVSVPPRQIAINGIQDMYHSSRRGNAFTFYFGNQESYRVIVDRRQSCKARLLFSLAGHQGLGWWRRKNWLPWEREWCSSPATTREATKAWARS